MDALDVGILALNAFSTLRPSSETNGNLATIKVTGSRECRRPTLVGSNVNLGGDVALTGGPRGRSSVVELHDFRQERRAVYALTTTSEKC
jgi:hypothetical protein